MKPNFLAAWVHCRTAAEHFHAQFVKFQDSEIGYTSIYETEGRYAFSEAAAALGYRLVAIEPEPVTDKPGFDGRDGGRWNEHSTAQEA